MPPKGDIEQFLDGLGDVDCSEKFKAVMVVLERSMPSKPSTRMMKRLGDTIDGKRKAIVWPWPVLSRITRALIPGTITIVAGPPASAKSLFVLESMAHWYQNNIKAAILELEDDLEFHLGRAFAQLKGDSNFLNDEWVKNNGEAVMDAYCEAGEFWDEFGECIHERTSPMMSLTEIKDWIERMASKGNRIIAVDPITIAEKTTSQPWNEDKQFMATIQKIAVDQQVSIILVTHPKKGRNGVIDLEQVSGGQAYSLFSQSVIWIEGHYPAKLVTIDAPTGGTIPNQQVNRTVFVLKSRSGKGTGFKLGYNLLGDSLRFKEIGIIREDG